MKKRPEQTVMQGIVTEDQIIKGWYRRIGAKGGQANTQKQQEHRRAVIMEVNRRRRKARVNEGIEK